MSTEVAQPDFDNIEAQPDAQSGEEKPRGKRKLLMMIGGAVVVLGLLGGGAYMFMGSSGEGTEVVESDPPVFFELPR